MQLPSDYLNDNGKLIHHGYFDLRGELDNLFSDVAFNGFRLEQSFVAVYMHITGCLLKMS